MIYFEVIVEFAKETKNFPLEILLRTLRACASQTLTIPPASVLVQVHNVGKNVAKELVLVKVTSELTETDAIKGVVEMAMRPFFPKTNINVIMITVQQVRSANLKPKKLEETSD